MFCPYFVYTDICIHVYTHIIYIILDVMNCLLDLLEDTEGTPPPFFFSVYIPDILF